jgi:phosphatidylglycerol:prolipoprotein diacylglycerol transferase
MLTLVGYAGITRLRLAELMDVFAPGLALGLALGRVGCFLAGCCWGDLCVSPTQLPPGTTAWQVRTLPLISGENFPLAVTFPPGTGAYEQHRQWGLIEAGAHHSKPVHPVQIYEAGLVFCLALALHLGWARRRWSGQVCCMLLLGYAMIRFGTEFLRADNRPLYLGLTLSQVISLALAGLAWLVWLRYRSAAGERTKVGGRWVGAAPLYR